MVAMACTIVHMSDQDRTSAGPQQAAARLARLSDEFFEGVHTTDPFNATQLGVPGFDALVPDPSRVRAARGAQRPARVGTRPGASDAEPPGGPRPGQPGPPGP